MGTADSLPQTDGRSRMLASGVECAKATAGFIVPSPRVALGFRPCFLIQILFQKKKKKCTGDCEMLWNCDKTVCIRNTQGRSNTFLPNVLLGAWSWVRLFGKRAKGQLWGRMQAAIADDTARERAVRKPWAVGISQHSLILTAFGVSVTSNEWK